MSKWVDINEMLPEELEDPLEETEYLNQATAFWTRLGTARETITLMEKKIGKIDEVKKTEMANLRVGGRCKASE
ncbi:hypothetical protein GB937_001830 [Aspergillus fischeri]|nr:hypothetical protein GB937_001830 [Aspergillus fischeri]